MYIGLNIYDSYTYMYILRLFVVPEDCEAGECGPSQKELYSNAVDLWNQNNSSMYRDAGFDLFTPYSSIIDPNATIKINQGVKCSMSWVDKNNIEFPVSYYLYPRSSTGTKTPLRLANSVGIIDSGYRGTIISAFDNISDKSFEIVKGNRLVQICPPELSNYIMHIIIVDSEEELGLTERGNGGFGSTGE